MQEKNIKILNIVLLIILLSMIYLIFDSYTRDKNIIKNTESNEIKKWNINKNIKDREQLVLNELKPFSNKLYTLVDYNGETGLHPLTPSVRKGWSLVPFKDTEAK